MKAIDQKNLLKMFSPPDFLITALETSGSIIKTKEYDDLIDFQSGCWSALLGHNRREIVEVIKENVGKFLHTHQFIDTEHPEFLVKELIEASGLKYNYKGTFISSGSEAVSLAVTLAEHITGRKKKLSFSLSYLGTSPELRLPRNPHQWMDLNIEKCLHCKKEYSCRECGYFKHIDFSQLAAFVFEPGNSGGLVLCPPNKLIVYLSEEVKKTGGLMVVNEVTTGFGRTGKWFGFQHYEMIDSATISPDIICLGKGLGNGYPISGILIKSELAEVIEASGYRYVQSHMNDPLGCLVARKVVEMLSKEDLVDNGYEMGQYLRQKLLEVSNKTEGIKEIRGRGMMNLLVLSDGFKAKEIFKRLIEGGIFTGYSEVYNYIHLYPPLIITEREIDALCTTLEEILSSQ